MCGTTPVPFALPSAATTLERLLHRERAVRTRGNHPSWGRTSLEGVTEALDVGRAGLLDRLVHGEVPVEPRDLERAPRLESRCRKEEAPLVREPRAGLDEDAERCRVDEL